MCENRVLFAGLAKRNYRELKHSAADEEQAVRILQERLHKAPGLSVDMLKTKIFGRFENDLEFCLVMNAAAPLYSDTFDPNAALQNALQTNYVAESHSKLYSCHCHCHCHWHWH